MRPAGGGRGLGGASGTNQDPSGGGGAVLVATAELNALNSQGENLEECATRINNNIPKCTKAIAKAMKKIKSLCDLFMLLPGTRVASVMNSHGVGKYSAFVSGASTAGAGSLSCEGWQDRVITEAPVRCGNDAVTAISQQCL